MGRKKSDEPQDNLPAIVAATDIIEPVKRREGAPTIYTPELVASICFHLSTGKSIRTISKMDDMPNGDTIFQWIHKYPEFAEQYARAKREAADAMAEDIMDISDDGTNDYVADEYNKGKTPGYALNGENIQRSKLRVDTRKWLMAKMKPKIYGDTLDVTSKHESVVPILGGIVRPKEVE